ncbi:MAG: glycosyltransferase family 4 protein [Acidobacteriaceae bacterium]|nr:glycosyltransferase family 4 protein [Acidobacteriaceae bacterium]
MNPVRLLAIIEANTVTGPAKNLLSFAHMARAQTTQPAIEVSIAVFTRPASSRVFIEAARELSISVHPVLETGAFDRSVLARLSSLVRELRPDLIQSHAVKSHLLVRLSGLNKLAPWVAFHHGYTWTDWKTRLYNRLDRWSLRTADRIVTVSRPFRDELTRIGVKPSRIEILHNAIDPQWGSRYRSPEARAALRSSLGIAPDRKIILIVGRLSLEKDHQTLIEALRLLTNRSAAGELPPPHLLIVGDGPERTRVQQTIGRLNLAESVTLAGQVPSAEPYYAIADVSVLSSRTEGSPNALLESMAARVPAVATAVGGVPEIVTHNESALLIKTGDREEMARAIGSILVDRNLASRLAGTAFQTILTRFTPEQRVKQLVRIYENVISGAHARSQQSPRA